MEDVTDDPTPLPTDSVKHERESTRLRVFVAGAAGMLGRDIVRTLADAGHYVASPFRDQFDIAHPQHLESLRTGVWGQFDWVINAAAYTNVDGAQSAVAQAERTNHIGAGLLAFTANEIGARFLHFSTDFVFDGNANASYDEGAPPNPINVYGTSKWHGEQEVSKQHSQAVIVRTSWLFGVHGKSFPRTMINAWREGKELRVVADQTGRPTYTKDLAARTRTLIEHAPVPGTVHLAGPDIMSWHEFAIAAVSAYRDRTDPSREVNIAPIASSEWPTPARRPRYSVLSLAKSESLGIAPMRAMSEALSEFAALVAAEKA
ncbi:MAG: dTDP-4-dehydrorhamnose reductase [Fimbriimonadaceae bacterium]|nr:dTDP-4-dehydrorhamnose reductase [Fimbriimonadaceae bacterium]